jgi:hypothetical protein
MFIGAHLHCRNLAPHGLDRLQSVRAARARFQMNAPLFVKRSAVHQVYEIFGFEVSKHDLLIVSTSVYERILIGSFTSFRSFSRAKNTLALMVETERFDMFAISS